MRVQVERLDLFTFGDQKWKKFLEPYFVSQNWLYISNGNIGADFVGRFSACYGGRPREKFSNLFWSDLSIYVNCWIFA